jgi:hypothetical protein
MSADQILQADNGLFKAAWPITASSPKRIFRTSVPSVTSFSTPRANTFGARNLAGVAGHARRSNKQITTKERKIVNV